MVKNLKYLREKKGISQLQLAQALGITQQSVNKYENQTTEPDIDMLINMADFFDTSIDFLLGHTNIERKYEVTYDTELNEEEIRVMEGYREVDKAGKEVLAALIRVLNTKK